MEFCLTLTETNEDKVSGKSLLPGQDRKRTMSAAQAAQPIVSGFSRNVGTTLAVGNLAWQLYKQCKRAPGSPCDVSHVLQSLHAVLKECEETLSATTMPRQREERLKIIMSGCHEVLEQLQTIFNKYESLGQQAKRTWDRMNWHSEDIDKSRTQLNSHVCMLTAFMSTSQARVEQKLNDLLREYREGRMEGSVVSTLTVDSSSVDERAQCRTVRKDLEGHGITLEMFSANRDFTVQWFADAIANGAFDEGQVDYDEALDRSSDRNTSQSSAGPQTDTTSVAVRASPRLKARGERPKAPRMALFLATFSRPGKALLKAAKTGDIESAQAVIRDGTRFAFVEQQDLDRALRNAALEGHAGMCRLLLSTGADIDQRGDAPFVLGSAPLHCAARRGHVEICKVLIETGADIDKPNQIDGVTSLAPAAARGHVEVCKMLIEAGADVNKCPEGSGITPLLSAAHHGRIEKMLIEAGADVEKAGGSIKSTPLELAAHNAHPEICKVLLEAGADVNRGSEYSGNPLEAVHLRLPVLVPTTENRKRLKQTKEILIAAGADISTARLRRGPQTLWLQYST